MMAVIAPDDNSFPEEAPGDALGPGDGAIVDGHSVFSGNPHKPGLPRNAASPNLVSVSGIGPDKLLFVTSNCVKFTNEKGGMLPEKLLLRRFSMYRCENRPIEAGMLPLNLSLP